MGLNYVKGHEVMFTMNDLEFAPADLRANSLWEPYSLTYCSVCIHILRHLTDIEVRVEDC